VDPRARTVFAELVLQLHQGLITFDEYDDRYNRIRTEDPVLESIHNAVWGCYVDLLPGKATGKAGLDPRAQQLIERCILFVTSDRVFHLNGVPVLEPTEQYRTKMVLFWISLCVLTLVYMALVLVSMAWVFFGLILIPICLYLLERILMVYWRSRGVPTEMERVRKGMEYWPFDDKDQYELCMAEYGKVMSAAASTTSD